MKIMLLLESDPHCNKNCRFKERKKERKQLGLFMYPESGSLTPVFLRFCSRWKEQQRTSRRWSNKLLPRGTLVVFNPAAGGLLEISHFIFFYENAYTVI
jgi:hypothetical protein